MNQHAAGGFSLSDLHLLDDVCGALAMQSIALQSTAELGGRMSLLARQRRDHARLDEYFAELARTPEPEQGAVLLAMYRLVFPHAFAEEAVLWPVLRRLSPDGHALTLQNEREHQAINALVTQLEGLAPSSAEHRTVLAQVVDLLREDVRDEEDKLLPRLQSALSPMQLKALGIAWEAVRRIAPTRAHPIVSRRPPGNVIAALPLAVVDRCRDALDALSLRHPGKVPGRVSAALTQASHGIERLPGMRQGEHPATRVPRGPRKWNRTALAVGVVASAGVLLAARNRRKR
jgi:hemerythrin superfamily protein